MRSKSQETINDILDFVNSYFDENKCSPSLREIEKFTGISRQTAFRYLRDMDERGILQYDGKRGTIITKHMESSSSDHILQLPVLGSIACGLPTTEEEESGEYIDFPASLLGKGKYFVLKTRHDSMINAGIEDGDLVIIKQQSEARTGQIVVALDEDGQNTLKRLEYNSKLGRYYLHPENEDYDDIYPEEIVIQGVAVKVLKDLF